MTAVEKLLSIAIAEIGYLEKRTNKSLDDKFANAGFNNYTKYARDLDKMGVYNTPKNGYAWCDMFCDWCFITAFGLEIAMQITGQPMREYGAGCTSSANYYKRIGSFYKSNPQPGDQIFFTNDGGKTMAHTGLVEKVSGGRVYTIEGNTSSEAGVVANGGAVRRKSYELKYNRIGGYGRPLYNSVPIVPSVEIEEEDEDMAMSPEKFAEYWSEYRKSLQDNDSSAYSEEARDWAIRNGLISGGEKLPNGEPNYMWNDLLTREQFVTVLKRFYDFVASSLK